MTRRNFQRNRSIVLASLNGVTTKELARPFNLAQKSITEYERHRLELSPDRAWRAPKSGRRRSFRA